jgi:hypothetical protein
VHVLNPGAAHGSSLGGATDTSCGAAGSAVVGRTALDGLKAFDHHLSAVLAKLGTPAREVAASQAAALGLVSAARS